MEKFYVKTQLQRLVINSGLATLLVLPQRQQGCETVFYKSYIKVRKNCQYSCLPELITYVPLFAQNA